MVIRAFRTPSFVSLTLCFVQILPVGENIESCAGKGLGASPFNIAQHGAEGNSFTGAENIARQVAVGGIALINPLLAVGFKFAASGEESVFHS